MTAKTWWRDTWSPKYSLCGGFQKYYPKDCKYIYDEFMSNISYWSQYYITRKITTGPVNGEQFFVEDQIKKKLKLKYLPETWVTRMCSKNNLKELALINSRYPGEYVYLDRFHDDIKIVHFKFEDINYSFFESLSISE